MGTATKSKQSFVNNINLPSEKLNLSRIVGFNVSAQNYLFPALSTSFPFCRWRGYFGDETGKTYNIINVTYFHNYFQKNEHGFQNRSSTK